MILTMFKHGKDSQNFTKSIKSKSCLKYNKARRKQSYYFKSSNKYVNVKVTRFIIVVLSQGIHMWNMKPLIYMVQKLWPMLVIGWLVVLRIYVALAIFQPYRDLEAGDNQSLKS